LNDDAQKIFGDPGQQPEVTGMDNSQSSQDQKRNLNLQEQNMPK